MKRSTISVAKPNGQGQKKIVRPLGSTAEKWLAAAAWILLWQICCTLIDLPLLLPSPLQTAVRLGQLMLTADFWKATVATFARIGAGFGCAVVLGVLLAAGAAASRGVQIFLYPLFAVIQAAPVASFTILALVWVQSNYLAVFISFIMVLPMVYRNVLAGIQSTEQQLLEMGEVFGFSFAKKLRYLYLPAVRPFFSSACATGIGFAWKSGIAAEVIGLPGRAMGSQIYQAKIYLETTDLFAWTAAVICFSVLLEKLLLHAMACKKQEKEQP